jgi:hypothetical protein
MAKFFFTCLILSTVLITYTVDAQDYSLFRKPSNVTLPEKIQGPLGDPIPAGTYSIGTGGYFPTIDSAFNKLSIDGVAGNVTLELIDELYVAPATQFGFLLNGPIPGAGPNSRVTIKPAENKNVVIQGDRSAVLYLVNTSYVTFDGVDVAGPTTLTIHALKNSSYAFNDGLDFINDCDHNIIRNMIFVIEDITRASGSGFWFSQTGSFAPDSNLIENNFVKQAGDAFFIISASTNLRGKGNIIRGNKIGSETDSLIALGIDVGSCENTIIENNVIQNLKSTISGLLAIQTGILSSFGYGDIIRNNIVHNLRASSGRACAGIFLYGEVWYRGDLNQVYNNMVYNINSTSSQYSSKVAGILMWQQNNPKIYYNSVYLSGIGSNPEGSAALYIHNNCSNVDAKNNIFVNTRDESPYCASAIYDYGSSNLTSDYNDLFYDDTNPNNCIVRAGGTDYHTLPAWQATGKDINSYNEMPNFLGPYLHINAAIPTWLESRGTPIAGIDTDFDGEPRHAIMPDIGADEFNGTTVPVELTSFTATSNGKEVLLNWSTATELNNYGFEIQRSSNEKDFFTIGFVSGNGTTTEQQNYSYTDKNLLDGKNYYRLKQIDYGGSFEYSDVIEVEWRAFDTYLLEQNFPNPFNPLTTIGYGIKEKGNVKMTVVNAIGEEVAVLVNEEKEAGYHTVEFNASTLPSGIYFYQLKAGEYTAVRKMILIK